jgi:xylulokinase
MINNYLGIDIGTSSAKCMLIDETGKVLAAAQSHYGVSRPAPGWAEQEPEMWWKAVVKSVNKALSVSGIDPSSICGIGFTGQMHGLVMLDDNNFLVSPSIIWSDTRSSKQVERIKSQFGSELLEVSGGPVSTGFLLSSLLWIKDERPDLYERTSSVLAPKDYLRFKCTGTLCTDPTDAAATGAFMVERSEWNSELLLLLGLNPSLFPQVKSSSEIVGQLQVKAAIELGLPSGIPVVTGCGDLQASALGLGIIRTDELLINVGTGGQVFQLTDCYRYDPEGRFHSMPYADGKSYHVMGAMLAAGLSISWFANLLNGWGESQKQRKPELDELFGDGEYIACKERLYFLPYLIGERTPHMNNQLRASFLGLSDTHNRYHLFRAVLEGVAFSLYQCYQTISSLTEVPSRIRAGGGPFRNRYFRQLISDVFGMEVSFADQPHSTVFGAAMLACYGITSRSLDHLTADWLRSNAEVTYPDEDRSHVYKEAYPDFIQIQSIASSFVKQG